MELNTGNMPRTSHDRSSNGIVGVGAAETFLIFAALLLYPLLALSVRHVVGASFLILVLVSLGFLWRNRMNSSLVWDYRAIAFGIAMALPTAAVLLHQIFTLDFNERPYDETLRFLFAVPVFLMLRAARINISALAGYAFTLGALITLIIASVYSGFSEGMRLQSYFLNTIHFGNLALILGTVSLLSIHPSRSVPKLLVLLQVAGFIAGLYLSIRTQSRGGWIAVPVLLLIWMHYNIKGLKGSQLLGGTLLIGVLCTGAYLGVDSIQGRMNEMVQDLQAFFNNDKDTSVGMRLQIWAASLRIFLDHPLFGVGDAGYREQVSRFVDSGVISTKAAEFALAEVHQQILSYAVKYGLMGLLSMLAVFLVPLVLFIRSARSIRARQRDAAVLGIGVVTAFFIFGLTVEIFNLKMTVTFYTMTVAVLLAAAKVNEGVVEGNDETV